MQEEGLRERKRRHTRAAIAQTAMQLFSERGFDRVSVAEIAVVAEVAEKTVYNYFPAKADLFFDEGDDLLAELLAAVGSRRPGESALSAVRGFVAGLTEWAAHRRPVRPTEQFLRMIADSPALQAHRRLMFARWETALAELLGEENDSVAGSVEPFVAAAALVAVLRVAFEAGGSDTVNDTSLGFDLLARGLDHYAQPPAHHQVNHAPPRPASELHQVPDDDPLPASCVLQHSHGPRANAVEIAQLIEILGQIGQ